MSGINKSLTAIGDTSHTPATTDKYNGLVRFLDRKFPQEFSTTAPTVAELSSAATLSLVSNDKHDIAQIDSYILHKGNDNYVTGAGTQSFSKVEGALDYPYYYNGYAVLYRFSSGFASLQRSMDSGLTWTDCTIANQPVAYKAFASAVATPTPISLFLTYRAVQFTDSFGLTWTERAMPYAGNYTAIAGRQGIIGTQFLAVADGISGDLTYAAVTTDEGQNWSESMTVPLLSYEVPQFLIWNTVANMFLLITDRGGRCSSVDGATWSVRTELGVTNCNALIVTEEGLFVICAGDTFVNTYGAVLTSPDGLVWTTAYTTNKAIQSIAAISDGTTTQSFCILTSEGARICRSSTPTAFVPIYAAGGTLFNLAASPQGTIIGVGEYGALSQDGGVTWTGLAAPYIGTFYPLAVGPNGYFLTSKDALYWISQNGSAWTPTPSNGQTTWDRENLIFAQGKFVAINTTNGVVTTRDEYATAWTAVAMLGYVAWCQIVVNVHTNRVLFIAQNYVYYTDNLVDFYPLTINYSFNRPALTSSPVSGLFIGVQTNGCATSPDGVTWTGRTIPAGVYHSVACSPSGRIFAVGANCCATSPDGISWTAHPIPAGDYFNIIFSTYHNKFIATAESGRVATTDNLLEFLAY